MEHQDDRAKTSNGSGGNAGRLPQTGPDASLFVLRERLDIHETVMRIASAMLQPREVVPTFSAELTPFFPNFQFTVAVHYPESRLFVVHAPGRELMRVSCDETIEGYFLHRKDEEVLAIEDYGLWAAPPPLNLARWAEKWATRAGLFAAARIHGNLVGVAGLQSGAPFGWDTREVEMLRAAAGGFGLAYYHAILCDNLIYSSREAHQRLEEMEREVATWRCRAQYIQTAADTAHALRMCRNVTDLVNHLTRLLTERWPGCRITFQRHIREKNAFEFLAVPVVRGEIIRPVKTCVQNLFLNNVPVTHIFCESPKEIAFYRDLDPQFVSECEQGDFRSFCTVPVHVDGCLWGTITVQAHEPGACSRLTDLLTEIGRAVAMPIQLAELRERVAGGRRERTPTPPPR
jgi:hypothetical protein